MFIARKIRYLQVDKKINTSSFDKKNKISNLAWMKDLFSSRIANTIKKFRNEVGVREDKNKMQYNELKAIAQMNGML